MGNVSPSLPPPRVSFSKTISHPEEIYCVHSFGNVHEISFGGVIVLIIISIHKMSTNYYFGNVSLWYKYVIGIWNNLEVVSAGTETTKTFYILIWYSIIYQLSIVTTARISDNKFCCQQTRTNYLLCWWLEVMVKLKSPRGDISPPPPLTLV